MKSIWLFSVLHSVEGAFDAASRIENRGSARRTQKMVVVVFGPSLVKDLQHQRSSWEAAGELLGKFWEPRETPQGLAKSDSLPLAHKALSPTSAPCHLPEGDGTELSLVVFERTPTFVIKMEDPFAIAHQFLVALFRTRQRSREAVIQRSRCSQSCF